MRKDFFLLQVNCYSFDDSLITADGAITLDVQGSTRNYYTALLELRLHFIVVIHQSKIIS